MIAVLDDNQWIHLDNITPAEDDILWAAFSVTRPGRYVDPNQVGNWDGVFRKYNRGRQRLARPFLSMLRGVCTKHNLPLAIRDNRPPWKYHTVKPEDINNDFLPGITLEDFQVQCIRKIVSTECGIIDIPTGGGKGELIAGTCKAISCPTLVLADQRVVIEQLKVRLELRDVADEVGMFYAGKRPNGQLIVVGSIQSLTPPSKPPQVPDRKPQETDKQFNKRMESWDKKFKAYKTRRNNAKALLQYVKKAEMLIIDECDKAVSDPWKNLFRHYFRGRRRYGFSGTPFDIDKPVEALIVQEHLGSVIFRESRENLTKLGRIIPCEYFSLAYGMDGSINEASAYDIAYQEHITESVDFHYMVAKLCKKSKKEPGDGTLVLVDREVLGDKLAEAINAVGLKASFIFGKTPQRRRNEVLRAFEAREIDVLIGGKIINRGLDLKGGCETLILACGGKLRSDFIQKVGRAVRINRRGKSRVYDFFFRCNRYLYSHSRARLKTMIHAGYRTTVVFPGGGIDGTELVKSKFHLKRKLLVPRPRPAAPARDITTDGTSPGSATPEIVFHQ
jgi:superfamily II DNA or RNA helicase